MDLTRTVDETLSPRGEEHSGLPPTDHGRITPILREIAHHTGAAAVILSEVLADGTAVELASWRSPGTTRLRPNGHGGTHAVTIDIEHGHQPLVLTLLRPKAGEQLLHDLRETTAFRYLQLWQAYRWRDRRLAALHAGLDGTKVGMLLLTRAGEIIYANRSAEEILRSRDGLARHGDLCRAAHLADHVNLLAALSHVTEGESDGTRHAPLLTLRRSSGPALLATVLAVPGASDLPHEPAAVVYVIDPRFDSFSMLSPLCRLLGLSTVETKLVCHLVAGSTLAEAAERMHVKEQTARGYLKQVFVKTGTTRQAQLIVQMFSRLVRMRGDITQEPIRGMS